jgi:oligopeptide transport system substrate-binding protein
MSSLPLVHKATYEANKVAPTEGVDLWTSKYNSSVETTMSWGPYKLESFQAGKQFVLVRNENWYGYGMEENDGLYQTDKVVYDIVEDWNSAWLLFQAGKVDGISIDVSIADDYKGSSRAYFTPSDFVGSLQLQSNVEQLKARETEGINKSLLGYKDFRQALSLGINRADYNTKCTTSSLPGFGLFNSMHYYDVENGGVFRNTDEARQVLCNIYGVDASKYASLEEAEDAITGYDLDLARQLLTKAYNEALAAGDIKATDKVFLTFGSGAITETVQRRCDFIKAAWQELAVGTPLEGRIDVELKDFATAWANDFRAGAYDVCMGGWTGAAWDPGYFLLAYLDPGYMYSKAWDTANTMMTFTMKGVGENGADVTETMGLLDWYACLNGSEGAKYNWSASALEQSKRLQLIAALEEQVLGVYYTVPLQNEFSASMLSFKVDYVTYEYNTFLGYGGTKYMTYNFDDEAWAAKLAEVGGELNYKN